jgi:hypothetical protein
LAGSTTTDPINASSGATPSRAPSTQATPPATRPAR